ncbi:helix-turn-helix transcriptional regulator [Chitinophaga sp.]|uniref:helix-turn-helix domain-containing protein n=1 Tax=Chitinophaga sp. TaxID=1869181 RepID=UPI0031E13A9E
MKEKKQEEEAQFEIVYSKIGKRLRKLRKEKDFTSGEHFAHEYGIKTSQYMSWERGQNMTLASLLKLARIHEIKLSELLSDVD